MININTSNIISPLASHGTARLLGQKEVFSSLQVLYLMKASAGVGPAYLLTFLQGMLFSPESVYLLLKVWHPQLFSQCKMFENVIMNIFDKTEIFILLVEKVFELSQIFCNFWGKMFLVSVFFHYCYIKGQ